MLGRGCSTPQPQPTDSSIRSDDETDVTDRTAQSQDLVAVVMPVVSTKLWDKEKPLYSAHENLRRFGGDLLSEAEGAAASFQKSTWF